MAVESKYSIRPLRMKDVAPMARIIGKIGLREFKGVISPESVSALMGGAEDEESMEDVVSSVGVGVLIDAAGIVCMNYDRAEKDIVGFLASVSGMTVGEVEDLPIADAFELVCAVFKAPDFADFFTRAQALLK